MNIRYFSWLFFLTTVLFAGGCSGPPQAKVKGVVKLDGKPIADAGIQFWPKEDQSLGVCYGKADAEGRFQIQSRDGEWVKPGRYVVLIGKYVDKKGNVPDLKEGDNMMLYAAPGMLRNILPAIYEDKDRSPFDVDVKAGDNDLPFDLKSKP